jgi:hypothetical protein
MAGDAAGTVPPLLIDGNMMIRSSLLLMRPTEDPVNFQLLQAPNGSHRYLSCL